MAKPKPIPFSQGELNEMFRYDPNTGILYNRITRSSNAVAGNESGRENQGYRRVKIGGKGEFLAHRIIWVILYGSINQELEVDHRDGIRSNNKPGNLRLVTEYEQNLNRRAAKGYWRCSKSKKWRAQIFVNRKRIGLGSHSSETLAKKAYLDAKKKYHQIKIHAT